MKPERLFNRNFTIMLVGQIMSLFGNSILRFSLSLYVLDLTGSASAFGGILAISMIPTVVLSPLGGVLADRARKQRIMVILDFSTAALIFVYDVLFARSGNLAAITALMVLLSLIQAFYQPSVQSSIPFLTSDGNLMAANGAVVQVQALANLAGPIIGGFLYGYLNIFTILAASCICFFLSAVMELFLRIPFMPAKSELGPIAQIKNDLGEAAGFLIHEKPHLIKLLLIVAGINLFLSALFLIGLPYLIKTYLGLSAQLYGFAEAALGLGTIIGALLSGVFGRKISFKRSYLFLFGSTLSLVPVIVVFAVNIPALAVYAVFTLCVLLSMCLASLFNISAQTFLQRQTPNHLLGKAGAFVSTICMCALPLGQAMYGGLFDLLASAPWAVLLFGTAVSLALVFATKRSLNSPKIVGEEAQPQP